MRKIALLLSTIALGFSASAQTISITSGSLTYTQDFNTLDTAAATSSANLPNGWSIFEYGTSASVNNQYKGGNGASNAGDTYSLGTLGTTERALGSLASGSLISHYGAKFVNNTGAAITSFTISYRGEEWRLGQVARTNVDSLRFLYSTTATNVSDTAAANWNENVALMFNTPNMTATTAGPLDGNLAGNYTMKTGVVTVTIPAGGSLVIKWVDPNIGGTDDALAVDDVSITFAGGGGPVSNRPNVTALIPANNSTSVAPNANLQITFDRQVIGRAAGNIRIKNVTDQTTLTKAGNSADVTVAANVVTIANTALAIGKSYYVTFDSTAFDTAGFKSYGIYDTTAWKFSVPTPNFRPTITPVTPFDNATGLAATTTGVLKMAFSRKVVKGASGNINVKNETDQTNQAIAVSSADVVLNGTGDTATVNNVILTAGKAYHVLVDSVAFDTSSYHSVGIVDTTRWNFSVQGPVVTVTSLNEQFETSCPTVIPGGWLAYSVTGGAVWHCSTTPVGNLYLLMNGGGSTSSTANEDWLITPRLNLSGQSMPMLAFKGKYRFAGLDMEVKYSTDYTGTGNPNAATWTDVQGIAFSAADSNQFVTKSATLTAGPSVFVAFKYTSGATTPSNGREWSVDSVMVWNMPNGVHTVNSSNNMPVQVIGMAVNGNVKISFDMDKAAPAQLAIYDLAGRSVYQQSANTVNGKNTIVLTPQTLQSGMYIIRVTSGGQQGIARTFIQ